MLKGQSRTESFLKTEGNPNEDDTYKHPYWDYHIQNKKKIDYTFYIDTRAYPLLVFYQFGLMNLLSVNLD